MNKKVILMILDGWGHSPDPEVSAIDQANTPYIDALYKNYPCAQLRTDGENVGLPEGQMGNSEVGHMNLGAGRIVYQDLAKINMAIKNKRLKDIENLTNAISYAKTNSKTVHLLGLLSDGGVHSHIDHLFGLIDLLKEEGVNKSCVHAFTDGRDVDPKSGLGFVKKLQDYIKSTPTKLATITGRYYAMDRDQRWERVQLAYDALVQGIGKHSKTPLKLIEKSYDDSTTDEFIKPIIVTDDSAEPVGLIEKGDVVLFFNFRTDRGRQLTNALSQPKFNDFDTKPLDLHFVTMTNYDDKFEGINVIFNKENLANTLGEILEANEKTQIRIAETEKYPHVTFFFSGGREAPFKGEKRILKNSPKVATYDLKPEMSAYELTDTLITELKKEETDFVCLNYANGDMVGHTGSLDAAIQACEAVDKCVKKVIDTALNHHYTTLVIADHGNCETMRNPDGSPHTAHTTNPVPIILVDKNLSAIKDGILGDVSPTILKLMGIEKPAVMTQNSLI